MIHLILGKQGSGKTLFLVKRAFEFWQKNKAIYSNVDLKFPYTKLNYEDIIHCNLKDGLVILDEIHLLLSARNSMSRVNRKICDSFLSMVRKKGLEVYGTTQLMRKVDIRFREEADYIYRCEKYAKVGKNISKVMHNDSLSPDIKVLISMEVTESYSGNSVNMSFIGNKYFKMFDTSQIIEVEGLDDARKLKP